MTFSVWLRQKGKIWNNDRGHKVERIAAKLALYHSVRSCGLLRDSWVSLQHGKHLSASINNEPNHSTCFNTT